MARMYYDEDANLDLLAGKTIAIIGYGSQGNRQSKPKKPVFRFMMWPKPLKLPTGS